MHHRRKLGIKKEKISILGCGWYGFALAKVLIEAGYEVRGSTTQSDKLAELALAGIKPYLVSFDGEKDTYHQDFFDSDILLISIPPKRNLPQPGDYLSKIGRISEAIAQSSIQQVIFISSTGVYQDGNFVVDESIVPQPDSPAGKALLGAEECLKNHPRFTTTILRFGGLFGPNRNLAKHFAGKSDITNGEAPINLIHLDDCLQISLAIIQQQAFGYIYHGVSPFHPTRSAFYTQACTVKGLEEPNFLNELLNWKQINSINLSAKLNYQFKVANWEQWLAKMADQV